MQSNREFRCDGDTWRVTAARPDPDAHARSQPGHGNAHVECLSHSASPMRISVLDDPTRLSDEQLCQALLEARWDELVRLVRAQFHAHSQDPAAVFEPHLATLKLRARLADHPDEWFPYMLSRQQLLRGELDRVALDFYAKYRRATEER